MEAAVKQHLSHLFFWLANKMSLTSVAAQKHLPLLLNTSKYKEAGGESLISTPGKALVGSFEGHLVKSDSRACILF